MGNDHAAQVEARLEAPLLCFALLTIPVILIEQSSLGEPWDTIGHVLNWLIWLAFVAEIVIMLRVVDERGAWLRSHPLDIAIVVLTPPFLPATLQAARVFRLFRLLRLLKAGVLARRLLTTEGVKDAAVLALLTILGGGAAFAAIEKDQGLSAWEGVWWAATTVTTVGYGDITPQTTTGRMIAILIMLVGIGFVAILTAAAAERFMRGQREEDHRMREQLEQLSARLDALESGRSAEWPIYHGSTRKASARRSGPTGASGGTTPTWLIPMHSLSQAAQESCGSYGWREPDRRVTQSAACDPQ
jgi:voltage-gated potassium channel